MLRRKFYTEAAFLLGLCLLALGTALTGWGGFGISMVVAPAYILHLKFSQAYAWFTFGVAEYILQALVLILLVCVLCRGKWKYLLSVLTTVVYGLLLDGSMLLVQQLPVNTWPLRIAAYGLGMLLCTAAIALLFQSYFPPAAYELFVKELAVAKGWSLTGCKTVYDWCSLVIAAVMSLCFFGDIRGIGWGTLLCAALYGVLIRMFGKLFDRFWIFTHKFEKVRRLYE